MSFQADFIDRVKQLIGITSPTQDDFSFFEAGGSDHFIQFLLLTLPDTYLELEKFDRFSLLFMELSEQTEELFQLDKDCKFATLVKKEQDGAKILQLVIDLRDQNLLSLYCFGDPKSFKKLSRRLIQSPYLHNCFINSNSLITLGNNLEHITGFNFLFEQTTRTHLQPQSLTGAATGNLARQIFHDQITQTPHNFNLTTISGSTIDGHYGKVTFHAHGELHIDICKVSVFFKTAELIHAVLKQKYGYLKSKIQKWDAGNVKNCLCIRTNPVELKLLFPLDKVDGLIKCFTRGITLLSFFGTWERLSLASWKIFITDILTKEQINVEVSNKMVRIFLNSYNSIPLVDKIESFVISNISPLEEDIYIDIE